jgi:hypothetical protein
MAVQLQITLPLDWASDFDRVAERWYFFHRPSGYCQYPLPKAGDEISRAAELVPRLPPRPVQQNTTMMEAMPISRDKQQSVVTSTVVQPAQSTAPVPPAAQVVQMSVSRPQQTQQAPLMPGSLPQQNVPGTVLDPLRRASGSVTRKPLRKPLPRQDSTPQPQQQQQHEAQVRNCTGSWLRLIDWEIGACAPKARFSDKPSNLRFPTFNPRNHRPGTAATCGQPSKFDIGKFACRTPDAPVSAAVFGELAKLRLAGFDHGVNSTAYPLAVITHKRLFTSKSAPTPKQRDRVSTTNG